VNTLTGSHRQENLAAYDAGSIINPAFVYGQVEARREGVSIRGKRGDQASRGT
jgi:hypothetical protein